MRFEKIYGAEKLFKELEKYCYRRAIISVAGSSGEFFQFDVRRKVDKIAYSTDELFIKTRIVRMLAEGKISITVRSFLDEKHPATGFPYKELRGFIAWLNERNRVCFRMIPAEDLVLAYTTDPLTGEPIPPEREAIYCDRDKKIFGEDLIRSV